MLTNILKHFIIIFIPIEIDVRHTNLAAPESSKSLGSPSPRPRHFVATLDTSLTEQTSSTMNCTMQLLSTNF
jgi:hypothetical protein